MQWVISQYETLVGRPKNGRRVVREINKQLLEIRQQKRRLREISEQMKTENDEIKKIIRDENDDVHPGSVNSS